MFRSSDLRRGRYSACGHVYLLTSVTHMRQPIFTDWRVGRLLVSEFRKAHEARVVHSMAWVVMPDHFHWLIELKRGSLGLLMRHVKSGSALKLVRSGLVHSRVWQKGFHDRALRKEEDLRSVARYIVANPIRAGLVSKVGDYPLWDAVW